MMPIRMVITGDNHLNYYSQKLGSKLDERRTQIGEAWQETIDFAIEKKADIYLNVGDLFDQTSPRNPPRARVVKAFNNLKEAGVKAFVISGTHESPATAIDGASPHSLLQEAGLATVFEDTQKFGQEIIKVGRTTVSIAGISTDRRLHPNMDPLENVTIPAGADYNVAMLHYSVKKIAPPQWEEPMITLDSLERNSQINLFAIGHIHQHLTKQLGSSTILYPGPTEHFDFGEAKNDTGFCYVIVEGKKIEISHIKTKSQPMTRLNVHTSKLSENHSTNTILGAVLRESNPKGLLQLILEGEMPFKDYLKIDFPKIFDEGKRRNFYYECIDNIRPVSEGIEYRPSEVLHPRNELVSIGNREIEKADSEDKKLWERALELAVFYYDQSTVA